MCVELFVLILILLPTACLALTVLLFPSFHFFSDEPNYWWFELAVLLNKTMMCGGLVVLAPGSSYQILAAILIMLFHLLVVLKLAPFVSDSEDWSSFITTLGLCLTSLGAYSMLLQGNKDEVHLIGVFLVGISVVCIATVLGIMVLVDCGVLHHCCKSSATTTHQNTQIVPVASPPTDLSEAKTALQSIADKMNFNYESDERHLKANQEIRRDRSMVHTQQRVSARLKVRKAKTLGKVAMFAQLTPEHIGVVLNKMSFTKYVRGDVICRQGEAANIFYVIVSGECQVSLHRGESDDVDRQVSTLNTLDYFGESSLIGVDHTRNATVTVSSKRLQVLHLNRRMFDTLVESGVIGEDAIERAKAVAEERAREDREFTTVVRIEGGDAMEGGSGKTLATNFSFDDEDTQSLVSHFLK